MIRYSLIFALLLGCSKSTTLVDASSDAPADLGTDSRRDTTTSDTATRPDAPRPTTCATTGVACSRNKLDILLVVDNSGPMSEEQVSLATEFPALVGALTDAGLDVHVGTISTDMGTGGYSVFTCNEPNFGDDGVLRSTGNTARPGCAVIYPRFLSFRGVTDVNAVAEDVTCVAAMGTQGCGFEQQLDAMLKALTPSTCGETSFVSGTSGHADGINAGFLREDAALAILQVSDEDDCSALDPDVYNSDSARYAGPDLNLRCFQYPEAVHPIQRYVDGLLQLKANPARIVYVTIAGIPADLAGETEAAILADERMQEAPNPDDASQLTPSCNIPGRGLSFPPRRLVSVGRDLRRAGAQVEHTSICQASFAGPMEPFIAAIDRAVAACE